MNSTAHSQPLRVRARYALFAGLLALSPVFGGSPTPETAPEPTLPTWAVPDNGLRQRRVDHLTLLGATTWHAEGVRGRGIKVAVLDSGFRGYRDHLGKDLPADVTVRTFRDDGKFEARNSQHGILCGEVVHAIAPEAELLFANWEPDRPDRFLDAVRWAREQGAQVITCSVISPAWSDGEGGGAIHQQLRELLGAGSSPSDLLCFASAGNVAQRHWAGDYVPGPDGWHAWRPGVAANAVSPWGGEDVTIEVCWSDMATRYRLEVIDAATQAPVGRTVNRGELTCATVRFQPDAGRTYAARVRRERGDGVTFHLTALGAGLHVATTRGSIPFPGDGPEVIAVGAVNMDGRRATYSACGPNSPRPKPDLVAPVPFASYARSQSFAGTSAASPQAAALAALLWARHPQWTAARVRSELCADATDLGPAGHDAEFGYGRIHLPGAN